MFGGAVVNWHETELLPERGKPKPELTYRDSHKYVLRAMRYLAAIGAKATDEAIFDAITKNAGRVISTSGARTRRSELVEMKFVTEGKSKGRTESGRPCKTWVLTEAGAAKAEAEFVASRQQTFDFERSAA